MQDISATGFPWLPETTAGTVTEALPIYAEPEVKEDRPRLCVRERNYPRIPPRQIKPVKFHRR